MKRKPNIRGGRATGKKRKRSFASRIRGSHGRRAVSKIFNPKRRGRSGRRAKKETAIDGEKKGVLGSPGARQVPRKNYCLLAKKRTPYCKRKTQENAPHPRKRSHPVIL